MRRPLWSRKRMKIRWRCNFIDSALKQQAIRNKRGIFPVPRAADEMPLFFIYEKNGKYIKEL